MSDERVDPQPPGLKSIGGGFFERTRTEGARTLKERTHPTYKLTRLYDSFPNALRVVGVMHDKSVIFDAFSSQERLVFHDPQKGVNVDLKMEEARKGVVRCLVTRAGGVEEEGLPQAALVDLRYVNGNLAAGSFQAESAVRAIEQTRPWTETFPELINYIRHQDPISQESIRWEIESRYGLNLQGFAGKSSPIVQGAHDLANDWTIQLIETLPMDDQTEAVKLLSRYGWHQSLTAYLLEVIDEQRVDNVSELKLDKDAFLSRLIKDEIYQLKDEDPFDYRQTLEVQRFGESDFSWREIEIDEKALLDRGEDERRVMNHGLKQYGEDIDVQQYRFKVDRNNGTITVTCSQGEKSVWISSFPLFIPHQEIVDTFEDLPKDFREIKDKVAINFD